MYVGGNQTNKDWESVCVKGGNLFFPLQGSTGYRMKGRDQ